MALTFSSSVDPVFSRINQGESNPLNLNPTFSAPDLQLDSLSSSNAQNAGDNSDGNTPVQAKLGAPIEDLANQSDFGGGTPLSILEGSVTLETVNGDESVTLEPDDDGRIARNADGSITVQNLTDDNQFTLESGERLAVKGEGRVELTGEEGNTVSFHTGQTLEVEESGGQTLLANSSTAADLSIGSGSARIDVSGDTDESFVLRNDHGRSIEFAAGETGELQTNDDGTIDVENEDTGNSVTFDANETINAGGEATASVGRGEGLEIQQGQQIRVQNSADQEPKLINRSTRETVSISEREEAPQPSRPLQLEILTDPEVDQLRRLGEVLETPDSGESDQRSLLSIAESDRAENQQQTQTGITGSDSATSSDERNRLNGVGEDQILDNNLIEEGSSETEEQSLFGKQDVAPTETAFAGSRAGRFRPLGELSIGSGGGIEESDGPFEPGQAPFPERNDEENTFNQLSLFKPDSDGNNRLESVFSFSDPFSIPGDNVTLLA